MFPFLAGAARFAWHNRYGIMRIIDGIQRGRHHRNRARNAYRRGYLRGHQSGHRRGSRAGYRARSRGIPREEGMGSPRGWYSRGRRRGY